MTSRNLGCVLVAGFLAIATSCSSNAPKATPTSFAATSTSRSVGTVAPSQGCGVPTVPSTTDAFPFAQGNVSGEYLLSVPNRYRPGTPIPMVLDLHGYLSGHRAEASLSGLSAFGITHGFATATPQINESVLHWDVAAPQNDVDYIEALLTHLEETLCLDRLRLYVAGMSNGAWMSSAVACRLSTRIAAVAAVGGIQNFVPCSTPGGVPVVAFHGTSDDYVAFDGGWGRQGWKLQALDDPAKTFADVAASGARTTPFGPLAASIDVQVAGWAQRNGCGATPSTNKVADDVILKRYSCPKLADVDYYVVEGGGHAWPGSKGSAALSGVLGKTTMSINATEIMFRFFTAHVLPAQA